ncbi:MULTISPECIES: hypothetical protein [unclassified Caballeronia]|uniref:hypothetical protein n=1 Tax=unclassified Caballeronia TaxID=2646786 RepID=UPI0028557132|nr:MULTISPECIES: hypothetical protein [unclassified Caballeronia]MDR5777707.1 hypothetical protein [Caballeronia sp. LZ002]MDR5853147.1 hypothetical protein [Caballeronia sp. LZ003]
MNSEQMFDLSTSIRELCNCRDEFEEELVETAALEAAYRLYYREPCSDETAIENGMEKLILLRVLKKFTKREAYLYRVGFLTMTAIARAGLRHVRSGE